MYELINFMLGFYDQLNQYEPAVTEENYLYGYAVSFQARCFTNGVLKPVEGF